jgi:hypothetical protein
MCLLTGITFCLAACGSDDTETGAQETEQAIGFFSNRIEEIGTRALITVENLKNQAIGVYGYKKKTDNTDHFLVFDNTKLTYTSYWYYAPQKYWDRTRSYSFLAYMPHGSNTEFVYNSGTSKYTDQLLFKDIPQWQKIDDSETDYLVAYSTNSAEEYLTTHHGTVNLQFSHIYAQLLISVVKTMSAGTTEHKITGMRLVSDAADIPTTQTCTYQYDAKTAGNCGVSSTRTLASSFTFLDNGSAADDVTVLAEATPLAHYLVAPFTTANNLKLYLDYTVTEGSNITTHNDVPVAIEIKEFKSNYKYTYVLRFETGKPVTLSVVEVKQWEQVEVTDEVYNW